MVLHGTTHQHGTAWCCIVLHTSMVLHGAEWYCTPAWCPDSATPQISPELCSASRTEWCAPLHRTTYTCLQQMQHLHCFLLWCRQGGAALLLQLADAVLDLLDVVSTRPARCHSGSSSGIGSRSASGRVPSGIGSGSRCGSGSSSSSSMSVVAVAKRQPHLFGVVMDAEVEDTL